MKTLRDLDIFDKFTNSDYATSTLCGKILSGLFVLFCLFFIASESITFMQPIVFHDLLYFPHLEDEKRVDFSFKIQVDTPCFYLHVDLLEELGTSRLNIRDNIVFKRMSQNDEFIGNSNDSIQDICLPCYGLAPEGSCCNSCEEIGDLLRMKGLNETRNIADFDQCTNSVSFSVDETETCLLEGVIEAAKAGGELHIAPGRNVKSKNGKHMHDFSLFSVKGLSHHVHEFSIGKSNVSTSSPFRGKIYKVHEKVHRIFLYDFFVTPKTHYFNNNITGHSYAYSLNEGHRLYHSFNDNWPGIYLKYSFSPLTVTEKVITKEPIKLIVTAAGILAGAFTIATALNGILTCIFPIDGPRTPVAFK